MDVEKSDELVSDHDVCNKVININETDILESDEENNEDTRIDKEVIKCEFSSLITDKYKEDMDAPTVANKLADLIIDIECRNTLSNGESLSY